ncbi:hypothetical protein [Arthrobacter sp. NPDC090010]|uniref:hypothetical protein n=1 Tax=Arthrobacter sp. NPDC090010 TaxID=3363942 RepID=UPI003808F766
MTTRTDKFMHLTEKAKKLFGPANRSDADTPVVHKHDAFEEASEEELRTFEIETDSLGHHYAVRRGHEEGGRREHS